ncbi:M1 family metallopeptidase [Lacinutrix neustonica]|uniref:M1 family metallopeptidase n=1 Tax=Lacinutrix neustonica TaxID=2980107 RepID=UPI0028BEC297|nr:M1 family metallopeptidase [Lacinutrix neustonica]
MLFGVFLSEAQQIDIVDFKSLQTQLVILPDSAKVYGTVNYAFEILKNTDSIYIDAINMKFSEVFIDNKKVAFHNDLKKVWLKSSFKKNEVYNLTLKYVAYPKKALYFVKHNNDWQIWTQGQGKYTSHWLPSIDDMNDKMEFDLSIRYDKTYEVIANGKLTHKKINDSTVQWHYDMQKPMSSYLVALAIGKYNKKELTSTRGIPIELYYYPEDSSKVEPTYRYTKEMFDFLEKEIGVPYPWQSYKQVPVKDFLYSGMENTSLTIFSDDFMIDKMSFIDKNYVNVNAHELAHQWFGNLVTETDGKHHWLQEGFATYYALLAERAIFGDDYYYWQLYTYTQELLAQEKANQATALLDPKASSTTFYKKGAWALHMLKEKVGDRCFKKAVKNYLEKYAFKNVTTKDFITVVETVSGQDLTAFINQWLLSKVLPVDAMYVSLFKNALIKDYEAINCNIDDCKKSFQKPFPLELKKK